MKTGAAPSEAELTTLGREMLKWAASVQACRPEAAVHLGVAKAAALALALRAQGDGPLKQPEVK